MSERAHVTAEVIKWARESIKMSMEDASHKVGVPVTTLQEWESGISYPTINQGKNLSKIYKRPFAVFFLPEIPLDFQPLQDFRNKNSAEITTSTLLIIREIQQKQAWISEVNRDNNERPRPFVGKYSTNDDPLEIANDIITTLDLKSEITKNRITTWIDRAETNGIFVSRTSFIHSRLRLNADEFQGFAIADEYAPFIFINTVDWNNSQLFTLVHELAHLWIGSTGISQLSKHNCYKSGTVEWFCNTIAANILMPQNLLNTDSFTSLQMVNKLATRLGVSSLALLVRAYSLKIITYPKYNALKQEAEKRFQDYLLKQEANRMKSDSGPSPYKLKLLRNGRLFTQVVIDAYNGGYIEPSQASSLLNTQINKFPDLIKQMSL